MVFVERVAKLVWKREEAKKKAKTQRNKTGNGQTTTAIKAKLMRASRLEKCLTVKWTQQSW